MTANNYKAALSYKLKQVRISLCSTSIWAFAKNYLPKIFRLPPSIMHTEVSELLVASNNERNKKLAIAEPHGYQLSQLTCMAQILWAICHQKETFIAIISVNHKQSEELLDSVKLELISNQRLRNDFPDAVGKNKNLWRRNELITRNGIKMITAGMNQKYKFLRFKSKKPSLIIFNNIDDGFEDLCSYSQESIYQKFLDIISSNTGDETNVLATGNITDCESVLSNIIIREKTKNWISKKYSGVINWADNQRLWDRWHAIYEEESEYYYHTGADAAKRFYEDNKETMLTGTKVLWPEFEDYYSIMKYQCTVEEELFKCKKLNAPHDPVLEKRARMREAHVKLLAILAEEL